MATLSIMTTTSVMTTLNIMAPVTRPQPHETIIETKVSMEATTNRCYRWKGKLISKKCYDQMLKRIENGKNRKKSSEISHSETPETPGEKNAVEGCRIVDIHHFANEMKCKFCKESLSLDNIEAETRRGLASILYVRCQNCLLRNKVTTGQQHQNPNTGRTVFDINTRAALAALHTGQGHTHVNKLLHTMNVPSMSRDTFKVHEREIGPAIEAVAKNSCLQGAKLEKRLTVENVESLQKLLPEDLQTGFIIPQELNTSRESDRNSPLVRIFASYDMGWSKRGTGRQYDSLNGFGALYGSQSKKILDYTTRNRKCRACDTGCSKNNHDCRLNFHGSAKAMEADAARELVTQSSILKEMNLEVGVFIGDNDSSSISAVRQATNHQVVKHSDMNHTAKGVTSALYHIDKKNDPDHELTGEAIKYLQRCFTYAVAQKKGDINGMTAAIRNIPFHAFNQHENCGDWCGYITDKENYKHVTVSGGFKNVILFEAIQHVFDKLAQNSEKFVAGASSQANESLNGIMSKKCPKSLSYNLSESADYRYACSVSQKNEGENYLKSVLTVVGLNPENTLSNHVARVSKRSLGNAERAQTRDFKKRRRSLQKQRSQLRHKKQATEGKTYQSNMGLVEIPAVVNTELPSKEIYKPPSGNERGSGFEAIVFFDLETSGFSPSCNVLQIAMKCENSIFNAYINPSQPIPSRASEIHGLTNEEGELHLHGKAIRSLPFRVAVQRLLKYLQHLESPCTLVAHNCPFDAPHLIRMISAASLINEFKTVVTGFVDTLSLFRKKFPDRKSKQRCTLTTLARETLLLSVDGAHDANYDVLLLEQLVLHHFAIEELVAVRKSFGQYLDYITNAEKGKNNLLTLRSLQNVISKGMGKRLAYSEIDQELLVTTYQTKGEEETIKLLEQRLSGKAQVIKSKKILAAIMRYLKEL